MYSPPTHKTFGFKGGAIQSLKNIKIFVITKNLELAPPKFEILGSN